MISTLVHHQPSPFWMERDPNGIYAAFMRDVDITPIIKAYDSSPDFEGQCAAIAVAWDLFSQWKEGTTSGLSFGNIYATAET